MAVQSLEDKMMYFIGKKVAVGVNNTVITGKLDDVTESGYVAIGDANGIEGEVCFIRSDSIHFFYVDHRMNTGGK